MLDLHLRVVTLAKQFWVRTLCSICAPCDEPHNHVWGQHRYIFEQDVVAKIRWVYEHMAYESGIAKCCPLRFLALQYRRNQPHVEVCNIAVHHHRSHALPYFGKSIRHGRSAAPFWFHRQIGGTQKFLTLLYVACEVSLPSD